MIPAFRAEEPLAGSTRRWARQNPSSVSAGSMLVLSLPPAREAASGVATYCALLRRMYAREMSLRTPLSEMGRDSKLSS